MLVSLRIENFALIDVLELTFGPGLNVLTGETGAGKSIILDALDIVLGGKINSRVLRSGTSKALFEASFRLNDPLRHWLEAADIDLIDETVLMCVREVSNTQGALRSRSRVNGVLVNKQQMESLRDRLVEITAQGQTFQLGQSARQREWLDAFGGTELLQQRQIVADAYARHQTAEQRLHHFRQTEQQRLQQVDALSFQLKELQAAQLEDPDEYAHLTQEAQRLSHSVELQQQSYQAYQLLYENQQGSACADLLGEAATVLEAMSSIDAEVQPIFDLVQEALAQVQEAGTQIHRYGDSLETDPQRLQEVELRLQQLKQLCRKYGPTLADAIAHQSRIDAELRALTGEGESLQALEQLCEAAALTLADACQCLTQLRQAAAQQLEHRLIAALKPLAMDKVQFQVDLVPTAPTAFGADQTIFAFSPNPGEPLQPLAETASGGEMSRFLLALKTCFSQIDPVATFAFDEVDVGVSGRVAQAIAETLYRLGQAHQILCVTHQPIVAAMADHHFHVEKILIPGSQPEGNHGTLEPEARTVVRIQLLEDRQRALELAHLAGGGETDQMLAFATSLLQQADQIRQQARTRSHDVEKTPAPRGKRAAQRKVSPKAS